MVISPLEPTHEQQNQGAVSSLALQDLKALMMQQFAMLRAEVSHIGTQQNQIQRKHQELERRVV